MTAAPAKADWLEYRPAPQDFDGRVIMVTGATAGIGRAVARELVRSGATVILHGRNEKVLEALYQELKVLGPEPSVAQIDLERAQGPQYQQLVDEIESRYGRLDGLLHNAALLGSLTPIDQYDVPTFMRVMHVNVTAAFILTRQLLPLLRASQDAAVLFTSSGVGKRGRAYWGAYSISKFACEGLTQVLAHEMEGNSAVRVNILDPGKVRTSMRRQAYPSEAQETLPTPESLTGPYVALLGPASRGVTGQRFEAQAAR